MTTPIPSGITTPDNIKTRIGDLKLFDGVPDADSAEKVYNLLDFTHAYQAYLDGVKIASMSAMRKGILELIRLLENNDSSAGIQITKNHIHISMGDQVFTSKLIDGKFPDYNRVIPERGDAPVVANRELLRQSLTRASILSNEKYRGVRIILEENRLRALAHNPEQEEAEEEMEVSYSGSALEIGFNVSYLLDAISIIKTNNIHITILDPNSSCLLLPEQEDNCMYVVMPMRL